MDSAEAFITSLWSLRHLWWVVLVMIGAGLYAFAIRTDSGGRASRGVGMNTPRRKNHDTDNR